MPAPEISAFGDADHEMGETGLGVDGGGFGAFAGSLWIYENPDRTGDADELVFGEWSDLQVLGVQIPEDANNEPGTRYLYLQREDLAWSNAFEFTLVGAPGTTTLRPGGVSALLKYAAVTAELPSEEQSYDIDA